MPAKPGSLRHYAERYGVSPETIRTLKNEGLNLDDSDAIEARLGLGGSSSLPLTLPESIDGLGIKAAVERLRSAERAAYQDYSAAKGAKDKSLAAREKSYLALSEQLRKVAGDEKAIEKSNENVVSKDELAPALASLFGNLRLDLESLPRRLAVECELKDRFEIEPIVNREVERLLDGLFACSYLRHE